MSGKLPPELLTRYILSRTGIRDSSVIIGPSIGEDAAIIDIGNGKILVMHVDPITGAVENIGWLAVHIACNDIAVRGVKPRWLLPVLFLPRDIDESVIDSITKSIDEAAKELEVSIVGGHSEYTPDLDRVLISMTAIGIGDKNRYISTRGARVGDVVIVTKTIAIEGTAILSTDFRDILIKLGVSSDIIERGSRFIKDISVVREALALAEAGYVSSMHDPTEGGLLEGLIEIAYASNKTIEIWEELIPIAEETMAIASALKIDPLRLISSGTLIAVVSSDRVDEALNLLNSLGIRATVIGKVVDALDSYVIIHKENGSIEKIATLYVRDELYRVWEKWRR
ncbi:MAG: AIR synthase family protein [Ignisphaera sp.]